MKKVLMRITHSILLGLLLGLAMPVTSTYPMTDIFHKKQKISRVRKMLKSKWFKTGVAIIATTSFGYFLWYKIHKGSFSEQDVSHKNKTDEKELRRQTLMETKTHFKHPDPKPMETRVRMWDRQQITLLPGEKGKKIISTHGLGGCTALALIAKCKSGKWHVMMSHYPPEPVSDYGPLDKQNEVTGLKKVVSQLRESEDSVEKIHLVVVIPGKWEKGIENKKVMRPRLIDTPDRIDAFKRASNVDPIISFYKPQPGIPRKKCDFMVKLTQNGATWKSFGDGHIPHKIS